MLNKGYIQVYTGDGKGKITAAIGMAMRAVRAGLGVYTAQFMKDGRSSEIRYLKRLSDDIRIKQFIVCDGNRPANDAHDLNGPWKWFHRIQEIYQSQKYEIVILEEVNMAVMRRLVPIEDLLTVISLKPEAVELVITGRCAHPKVIERADLVTEMKAVKHYFYSGVEARLGIEK